MQYTRWFTWGVVGGLVLSLCTIFIVATGNFWPNMFFPFITGKNFAFRMLIEIVFALYVLLAIREPKYRPRSSLLMWAVGLFVLWMAVATAFSVDPVKSFWSNFERMDGYITMLHMFAFFIVAGAVLTAEKWWHWFFRISVGISVVEGLYALMQITHLFGLTPSSQSGPRADGHFGNAIYLAVFMLFNIFITLYLVVHERGDKALGWRIFYGIALVLQATTLFYTETRGALIGVLIGIIIAGAYLVLFARAPQWRSWRKWSLWGVGAVVVLAALFFSLRHTAFVQNSETLNRFASISLTDRTTIARFQIWGEAWQGFKERPITGWGQENFSFVFNNFYNPNMYDQEQWFDRAHNAFIDWAVAGGAPAFLLYLSLFALAAWAVFRSELQPPEQAIFIGLLAAYGFNNLTVFDNLSSYLYFYLILAFAHSLSRRQLPGWMFLSKPLDDRAVAVAAPIVLVILVWGGWVLNGPGMARAQTLIDAITPQNLQTGAAKDPKENLASFQTALADGPLGYQETVEQLFQFSSNSIAPSSSVSPETKQQAYTQTRTAADQLLKQRPNDARLEIFYGVFLNQFGQYPEAITYIQKALADSPGKQQILFEIGSTYLATGDYKNALAPLKQAYDETPQYPDARIYYASALYYNNQGAEADQLLTAGFGTVLYDNQTLMQVYYNTKQYGRLAQIYEARIAKNPGDAQAMLADAVLTYFAGGSKEAAIAELKKAASTDPSIATQINSFIDQINAGTLKP